MSLVREGDALCCCRGPTDPHVALNILQRYLGPSRLDEQCSQPVGVRKGEWPRCSRRRELRRSDHRHDHGQTPNLLRGLLKVNAPGCLWLDQAATVRWVSPGRTSRRGRSPPKRGPCRHSRLTSRTGAYGRASLASEPARQRRRLENTPEAGAIRAVGVPRTQRSSVFGASLQVAEKRTLEDIDGDRALGGAVSAATDREPSDRRRPTSWRSLETVGAHVKHRRRSLYPRRGSRVPSRHRLPASSCERQGPAAGTCNNQREPAAAEAPTRTERVQVVVDLVPRSVALRCRQVLILGVAARCSRQRRPRDGRLRTPLGRARRPGDRSAPATRRGRRRRLASPRSTVGRLAPAHTREARWRPCGEQSGRV